MSNELRGWTEVDPFYPGVIYFRCGHDLCGWNSMKPCPLHPQPYDPLPPASAALLSEQREWRACPGCKGSGSVAGRNEYEVDGCPECNGTGEETERWTPPTKEQVHELTERCNSLLKEVRKAAQEIQARDKKIIELRKRLVDAGIVPEPELLAAARREVPQIGFKRGKYLWCYELNDWVTVNQVKNPYVYVTYRGIRRTFSRPELTEHPPDNSKPFPKEVEFKET